MKIPKSLVLVDSAYSMDGGSIYLEARDEDGAQCSISLPQHRLSANFDRDRIPGRLHLNGSPVAVRSESEALLVSVLRAASVQLPDKEAVSPTGPRPAESRLVIGSDIQEFLDATPEAAVRLLARRVVDFVSSAEYLVVAKSVDATKH